MSFMIATDSCSSLVVASTLLSRRSIEDVASCSVVVLVEGEEGEEEEEETRMIRALLPRVEALFCGRYLICIRMIYNNCR